MIEYILFVKIIDNTIHAQTNTHSIMHNDYNSIKKIK